MQVAVARVYVGPFMTSLDMAGFSLSLLLLDNARTAALDAPTQASLLYLPLSKPTHGLCLPRQACFGHHYINRSMKSDSLPGPFVSLQLLHEAYAS